MKVAVEGIEAGVPELRRIHADRSYSLLAVQLSLNQPNNESAKEPYN